MGKKASSEEKQKPKMGRPKKPFDPEHFEKLCGLQCTEVEIAGWFGFSIDTLNARCKEIYSMTFSDTFKEYSQDGKISLRRNQFKLSAKSAGMAIWLGKQYLGQKDNMIMGFEKELAETEYTILSPEEEKEAKDLLKEFES